jgi:hypothetical protein
MMEIIKQQRDRVAHLKSPNELSWMIDMTEVFLRFTLDDWERAEELLRRMPKTELVRQIELNGKFQVEPKKISAIVDAFPENTPREKVSKFFRNKVPVNSKFRFFCKFNRICNINFT